MPQDLPAWKQLTQLAASSIQQPLGEFCESTGGFENSSHRVSLGEHELMLDLSKQRWDQKSLGVLLELANECGLAEQRKLLFEGAEVNNSAPGNN